MPSAVAEQRCTVAQDTDNIAWGNPCPSHDGPMPNENKNVGAGALPAFRTYGKWKYEVGTDCDILVEASISGTSKYTPTLQCQNRAWYYLGQPEG